MSAALYKTYDLSLLATLAADDLSKFYANRSTPVPALTELMGRFKTASLPITPPSESAAVLSTLRLSTVGGTSVSTEAIREFAGFTAERLNLAMRSQPPENEYKYLISLCLRVADSSPKAAVRMAPTPAAQSAARL